MTKKDYHKNSLIATQLHWFNQGWFDCAMMLYNDQTIFIVVLQPLQIAG